MPSGTELDCFQGQTYASLIGFEFNRTGLAGTPIPFHQSFEEVNLRFYVKRADRRGVVFIRELVPRYAVAAIARFAFGENLLACRCHTQSASERNQEYLKLNLYLVLALVAVPCGWKLQGHHIFRATTHSRNSLLSIIGDMRLKEMAHALNTKFSILGGK